MRVSSSLSTTTTTLFTGSARIAAIQLCNTTANPLTARVYIVPNGESASTSNALFYELPVLGNQTVSWDGRINMDDESDTIQASASLNGLSIIISGD
jgi:hypothetical protein